jgi:hypothetical protein
MMILKTGTNISTNHDLHFHECFFQYIFFSPEGHLMRHLQIMSAEQLAIIKLDLEVLAS